MKKYVKPELFYEHFELTEHIAACTFDHKNTYTSFETCSFTGDADSDWPDMVIFLDGNDKCIWPVQEYCYYTGSNGMNTFNS